jgi:hypothetical protein
MPALSVDACHERSIEFAPAPVTVTPLGEVGAV